MTALVEGRALTAGYGARDVVHDVSITLAPGECAALVGPNAAGKSTFLRVLGGALAPRTGTVTLAGTPLSTLDARGRGRLLALVPQSSREDLDFSVREMIAFGRAPHAGAWGLHSPVDDAAIDRAVVAADVAHLTTRAYAELSGGEKQRVLFARALAQEARVLLLDEPTAHLDLSHQLLVLDTLAQHAKAGGAAIVALHDLALAARLPRLLVLDAGRLVADGAPQDVLTPARLRETWGLEAHLDVVDGTPALRLVGRAR